MEVNNKTLAKYLAEVRRVEKSRSEGAEKEIRKLYKKLLKDLNSFVGEYYTKYSDDEGILSAAILQQKAKYAAFLEEVDKNINEITPEVSKTIKKTVEDTYKACYKGMVNAFTGAVDDEKVKESFKGLSIKPEVIKAAVENPIGGLTLPERLKKNRQEVIYDIKQNISTALMTGERYDTTAKKIAERLDVSYGKAIRIVRTESHRVEEKGLMDGAEEIGEKVRDDGLVYAVIWRNMGDNRVRPNSRVHTSKGWKTVKSKTHADHVKMEGQIIEAGGYFDLGHGVKAKSPGESGDAANDINCRCYVEYEMMTEEEFKERGGKFKESKEKVESRNDTAKTSEDNERGYDPKEDEEYQEQIRKRREAYRRKQAQSKISLKPDFDSMDKTQLEQYISLNLKTKFEDLKGANTDFVRETVKAIDEFEQKMGGKTIEGLSVRFGSVKGAYAKYDDTTKTLLLKKGGNLQAFEEAQKSENIRYRQKWKKDKDYHATTTYKGTVFHELGHAVDIDTGQNLSRILSQNQDLYEKSVKVSVYAGSTQNVRTTKASEAWAENFAAYMDKNKNVSKVPDEVAQMIEEYFNNKKFVVKSTSDDIISPKSVEYMSNSFRPKYGKKSVNKVGNIEISVKKVDNSKFNMYTDIDNTSKNKAVRLTEKNMRKVAEMMPEGFEMPKINVVDFDKHGINSDAIAGFYVPTNTVYINSKYDTPEKIREYVNRTKGYFSNSTEFSPYLHELGHKQYKDALITYAEKNNITVDKAANIVENKLMNYISEHRKQDIRFINTNISGYANNSYTEHKYSEIFAECYAAEKNNDVIKEILRILRGDD